MVQVLWEETPTARQHHECSFCGRTINPGETYRRTRCLHPDVDAPYTFKECAHCQAFLYLYLVELPIDDDGYTQESVEEWEPTTPEAVEHKRQWSIGWRHGRELYPAPEISTSVDQERPR